MGAHSLKGWSKTQSLIALSSGESEVYAALKASAETLAMVSILKDLGYNVSGEVWGDASAALGVITAGARERPGTSTRGSCGFNKQPRTKD